MQIVNNKVKAQYTYEYGAIYNEDCINFLKSIKSKSVDMVFADPPYNIKKQIGMNLKIKMNI